MNVFVRQMTNCRTVFLKIGKDNTEIELITNDSYFSMIQNFQNAKLSLMQNMH